MPLFKTIVGASLLAVTGGMFLPAGSVTAEENPACDPVSGSGATVVNPMTGDFEGTGTLTIRGEEFNVEIITSLIQGPVPGDDGTLHATTQHTFTFPDGSSFTTTDKAILEPTETDGTFTLNSNMEITWGTGDFAEADGRLHGHGQILLFPPPGELPDAQFDINGVICNRQAD